MMDSSYSTLAWYGVGAAAVSLSLLKLKTRLELSKAKHPSLSGHSRMSRRIAALIPFYEYDEHRFFRADSPPEDDRGTPPRGLRATCPSCSGRVTPKLSG